MMFDFMCVVLLGEAQLFCLSGKALAAKVPTGFVVGFVVVSRLRMHSSGSDVPAWDTGRLQAGLEPQLHGLAFDFDDDGVAAHLEQTDVNLVTVDCDIGLLAQLKRASIDQGKLAGNALESG